jgi:hypothetical protein
MAQRGCEDNAASLPDGLTPAQEHRFPADTVSANSSPDLELLGGGKTDRALAGQFGRVVPQMRLIARLTRQFIAGSESTLGLTVDPAGETPPPGIDLAFDLRPPRGFDGHPRRRSTRPVGDGHPQLPAAGEQAAPHRPGDHHWGG